jgi:outer membrane protein insertion porin family
MQRLVFISVSVLIVFCLHAQVLPRAMAQDSRLVENVDIRGNRAIPTDTIKLYIQTKRGDVYSEQQVQRDFQAVLAQGFFDEFDSRVTVEEGPRGGVVVIFYVKERPIIRDITYEGLKSVQESDVIQRFRERRVGVSKESRYDPVNVEQAKRALKELLAEKGKPNAQIDDQVEEISATTVAINFVINEGKRVRITKIDFEGNQVFSDRKLRKAMKLVKQSSLFTIFSSKDIYDKRKLDEDLQRVRISMGEKGYIRPRIGEPEIEEVGEVGLPIPLIGRRSDGIKIKVPIDEGQKYTFGKITVEGNSLFNEELILAVTGMKTGDVASAKIIREGVFERLRKLYGRAGYIQATTDLRQDLNETTAIADFTIVIEEGKPFTIRRIEFKGNTITRDQVLRREILVNEGDTYNQELFDLSRLRLNQLGYFEEIKEEDVQFQTDERNGVVDIELKVKEKGRQQISFTGGASGIGGSFIGISYSTNNLFGYGESLAFEVAAGNRQRNFSISFTEPYLRGRPISAGISVFTSKLKFFGGGLSTGFFGGGGGDRFVDNSLFTRDSTGFSISFSSPLTYFTKNKYLKYARFTRIGLSYGFSSTKVIDPPANRDNDPDNDILVSFTQPDISTSTITPSLVYNTLNNPIDPTGGTSLSATLSFSGLGGDVKVIFPAVEFKYFTPIVKREKPQVLGMRILAEKVISFGSVPATNSLSFVGGVPIFNRFFLGGEDSIRGFNVRSLSPIARVDRFVSTTNIQAFALGTGRKLPILRGPRRIRGIDQSVIDQFTFKDRFTGNPNFAEFTPIGADTQLLYNIEYRIPIAGPLSIAAFADAGTAFNTAPLENQVLSIPSRNELVAPVLILNPRGRVATQKQIDAARTPETPVGQLPRGFRFIQIGGDVTRTSIVRLAEDFSGIGENFRASIGAEVRVQVPVVGVPFRLIFAYNPNAKTDQSDPTQIFLEQKRTIRFTVGRTF